MNHWFLVLFGAVVGQRIAELRIAKRNERYLKQLGAVEYGHAQYKWIVLMHVAFLCCWFFDVAVHHHQPARWFVVPLVLFLVAQGVRLWAIRSLGPFWNTKVFVVPNMTVVTRGPYRFLRHPNYVVVAIEILTLPLIFQAYETAALFTLLNAIVLSFRIPLEEKALGAHADYNTSMQFTAKFVPVRKRL